jgi:hypothetical protein
MGMTYDTIDHVTLMRLVEANAVRGASVIGQAGGWGIVIQYGMTERALAAKRGAVRVFKKFETLVRYMKSIGLARYQVDASNYEADAAKVEPQRSDAAARMKAAHAAAAYTAWLNKEVQAAIDDQSPSITHAEVLAAWQIERSKLLQQAENLGA